MKKLISDKAALALTIFIFLLLFLSATFLLFPRNAKSGDLIAEVYQNGILIRSIRLSSETADFSLTVEGENGAYNVIEVRSGSIAVTSASCPDHLCVHQGFRSDTLLPITCLPNHLVIRIRPADKNETSDALNLVKVTERVSNTAFTLTPRSVTTIVFSE